jgi:hypothetical protein
MFDPARLMERKSYYLDLLPWLARWGYNLLQLHLTDDEGCALVFPSRPELASRHAFRAEEMRELVGEARRHGIEVVPEIETLGHTRFITGHRKYRHLGTAVGRGFGAIDPDHPETRELLADLIGDAAEIFDSELVHVGLDEVNLSVLPRYEELPLAEHWRVFARHARWVHDQVRRLGRRPAMWTDHLLQEPRLAAEFDSDVLMVDWHYTTPFWESSLELFARSPFEFWGAPATICWMSCISPNPVNIGNLREFSARALRFRSRGLSGMLNTVWCPWRNLTGAIDLALGLGGHLFSNEAESSDYPRRFAQDFYGLARRDAGLCGDAIMQLYMHAPDRSHHERVMAGSDGANRFSREDARLGGIHHARMTRIAETLAKLAGRARRNAERLGDVVLTARALAAVGDYAAAGRRKGRVRGRAGLVKAVERAWDRDRYLDDPRLRRFKRTPEHYLRAWMIHGLRSL